MNCWCCGSGVDALDSSHVCADCQKHGAWRGQFVRKGGFVLCGCGHMKSFHVARAEYYGGPLTATAPCAHCACAAFEVGMFQGVKVEQEVHG